MKIAPDLPRLPPQPDDTPWPTREWPLGSIPDHADAKGLARLVDHAFSAPATNDLGESHALVIVQGGRLLLERYGDGFGAEMTYPSWSMAKSITQALVGILVGEGKIDPDAPADVPEWREAGDPRRAITLDLLMRMSSGLAFVEDYVQGHPSDVIEMLWGKGKEDVAHFAASFPLAHEPGRFWSYASGTSNIISRIAAEAAGAKGPDFERFMRERLFSPIGMTSAAPKFDAAGTFIGSSFCYATARDFARFGLLYMRDGIWAGRRLLPEGWVDYARTPTWQQPNDDGPYGAQWWLGLCGPGSFSANGYEGQYVAVVPALDLIIVRHGKTAAPQKEALKDWIKGVSDCFRRG